MALVELMALVAVMTMVAVMILVELVAVVAMVAMVELMAVIAMIAVVTVAPGFHVDVVAQLLSTQTMTKNNYVTLSIYGEIPFHTYEG